MDNWIIQRLLDPQPLNDEELDEQVRACLVETGTFINFHHPLYIGMYLDVAESNTPPQSEQERTLREAMQVRPKLRAKHQYIHERASLESKLVMFERPYRKDVAETLLIEQGLAKEMQTEELRSLILWLWTDTEFPSRSRDTWQRIFDALREQLAPPFGDLDLGEKDTMTVYRGIAIDDEEVEDDGLSWTISKETAAWFARRLLDDEQEAMILEGEVAVMDIWFATDGRGEKEVVSDAVRTIKIEEVA